MRRARDAWPITIPDTRTSMHEGTRSNNTWPVMKRTQPDWTEIFTADAVDAKSCKAEETEERIRRMETIDRDRAMQMNANDMWEIPGRIIDAFQTRKKAFKRKSLY